MFDLVFYKKLFDILFVYIQPCNVRLAKKGEKKGSASSEQVLNRDFGESYSHDGFRDYVLYFYPQHREYYFIKH